MTGRPLLSMAAVLWRLAVFAAAMIMLLVVIVSAITRPLSGDLDTYQARFSDASGLKTGDDVRMFGVAVGKVAAISLDHDQALVRFTVQRGRPMYTASVLAIRYQTLTGQRYIDVRQPNQPTAVLTPGTTVGVDHTVPSFDITALFNGLEPVLKEFSPAALNQFSASILAVIEGDGTGLGPALAAIEKLSDYVTDRQTVISTIFANLKLISDQIGGSSPHLVTLLQGLSDVVSALQQKVNGLIDFAMTAPSALGPLNTLLDTLGFSYPNNPDLDHDFRLLFPDPKDALAQLGKLPGLLQALDNLLPPAGPSAGEVILTCTKGKAAVPVQVGVLIAGQRISLCNG